MPHIVSPKFRTKRQFVEAVNNNPDRVYLDDPSMFNPISGSVSEIMRRESMITATNHPKRSWYAMIKRTKDGGINVT